MKQENSTLPKQVACKTEKEARQLARKQWPNRYLHIIHSAHADNKNGDFFIERECPFVRMWETEIYHGLGRNA